MKFATLQCLVAGAALVAANPLRVIMISSHTEGVVGKPRFGMPVVYNNPNVADIVPKISITNEAGPQVTNGAVRTSCRMREKMLSISNVFRKALGLPLIETHIASSEGAPRLIQVLPFIGTPAVHEVPAHMKNRVMNLPHPHHRPHRFRHQIEHDSSFLRRLHVALITLGPWEGRAVAFVLGCGIGVLLRMIWVLAVISYRSLKGQKEDTHEYSHIVEYIDDAEEIFVAPPSYILVDEKQPIEETPADAPKPAA